MLGPYEVVAPLGAGGMGEVYRARDTRLGREVAIKVLPGAFAADRERLARFEREARAIASLSHPNILALHDLGTHEGTTFAVMELLEGETLRTRLVQGPLPVRRAVEIAVQIAHGLAAAHDKGIVHRDPKPENLWLGHDGTVKILDFGLAKQSTAAEPGDATLAATAEVATGAGVVMGTVGYMSPEQVRGGAVDARTDLFSFGAVLYEMLSGRRAFQRETAADTMSAILKEDPPDLAPAVIDLPPVLDRIVRRCLEKQTLVRFQSARDLAFALEAISSLSSSGELRAMAATAGGRPGRGRALALGAAALTLVAVALLAGTYLGRRGAQRPLPRFEQLSFRRGFVHSARFAPDHQSVIYGGAFDGQPVTLYSTRIGATESRALDLPSADVAGISNNGVMALLLGRHHVGGWMRVGTLARVPLDGGSPLPILEEVYDADISPDGERFAVVRAAGAAQQLEYPVGHVVFRTGGWITQPRISPDGRRVACVEHPYRGDDIGHVVLVDERGHASRLSGDHNTLKGLCWAASGAEILGTSDEDAGGELWSVSQGRAERALLRTPNGSRIQDVSPDGKILLVMDVSRADLLGRLAGDEHERRYNWWSDDGLGGITADGTAFLGTGNSFLKDGEYQLYLRRNDGRQPVGLGPGSGIAVSADGRWVIAGTLSRDRNKLRLIPTGLGQPRVIDLGTVEPLISGGRRPAAFSEDGARIVFIGSETGKPLGLYTLDLPDGRPRRLGAENVIGMALAPDGHTAAVCDADGRILLVPDDGGAPRPVPGSKPGDVPVTWDPAGRTLLVWDGAFPARVFRIDPKTGRRELAVEIVPEDPAGVLYGSLAVSPDGKHYVYRARRVLSDVTVVTGVLQ
jgi:hypothetical protein